MPSAANPVFANVAVLRIAQFESRSVADQASRKEKLERATRDALAHPAAGEFTDTRVRQHTFYTPDARRGAMHRRRMVAYAIAGAAAILLLGAGAREAKIRFIPPAPAIVTFNVKPRGEVVVDGMLRGRIP